jgi:hypothetical protein
MAKGSTLHTQLAWIVQRLESIGIGMGCWWVDYVQGWMEVVWPAWSVVIDSVSLTLASLFIYMSYDYQRLEIITSCSTNP